jgi:hypothetical protein
VTSPNTPSRWVQPVPRGTDENLKHVHRKIDRNLKTGPLVDNAPRLDPESGRISLPGAPSLMARVVQQATAGPSGEPATATAPPPLVVHLRPEALLREELDVQIPDLVPAHVNLSFTRSA